MKPLFASLAFLLGSMLLPASSFAAPLELKKGDHISFIGNTLPDRMQHDGWLEARLQTRLAGSDLVIRNLGFSGDEINLRLRSENFGSPDSWLSKNETDVVLAFFGYGESFAGEKGVEGFKNELGNFIKHTQGQKYNGESAPRLVLISPIAHEDIGDKNLPSGKENNERLKLYSEAMAEVAQANNVLFVDLFTASQDLYAKIQEPLTINGIHLTTEGNRHMAAIIEQALLGPETSALDTTRLEEVRRAVLDKNFHWYNRYRTVDGYSIYGGRAGLKFVDGQTNFEVMQREMQILDEMTANRDQKIWAVSQGKEFKLDDSNTADFIPVKTNRPGSGPGGTHVFLSGEESLKKMDVHEGLKVEVFASEEQFPELINPVQMAFDTQGRLWVSAWPSYPHWKPKDEMNDQLLILEDTNGDGKADVCKEFAGGLHNPTGFEFWNGGVLVAMAPDLLFLKDTDGDDKADVRERVLSGLDTADTHHTANSFVLDPGGALYFQEGTFHHTQVETPYRSNLRTANGAVFRYDPRRKHFSVYTSYGFANPHGHVFDRWGQDIVHDGTGADPYHGTLFSGHLEYPRKHGRAPHVYQRRTRPCPATEYLSSRHFPEEMQGNLLVENVIGFQGILNYKIEDQGSTLSGKEMKPILSSSDVNFRPVDLEVAPDGSLYFTDWLNPIIGHMQHNLRDPSRDQKHGRVYRVTCPDRPLLKPAQIAGQPVEKLLDLLKEPEDRTRYRARIELSGLDSKEVQAALTKWIAGLDKSAAEYEHHMMEALWVHQHHNLVNQELLKRMLRSSDANARAAATRVLCYWLDQVEKPLELLKPRITDESPRVRLEAVRTCSFFTTPEATETVLLVLEHPMDPGLEYALQETLATLDKIK